MPVIARFNPYFNGIPFGRVVHVQEMLEFMSVSILILMEYLSEE